MSDALGKVAESFDRVCNAVRTVKLLRDKNWELSQMIEITKTYASKIEELDLPAELIEERGLHDTLMEKLKNALRHWSYNYDMYTKLYEGITKFIEFLTNELEGSSTIPPAVIQKFSKELNEISKLAVEFYGFFEVFVVYFSDSQQVAERLTSNLKQRIDEAEKAASSSTKKGVARTIGLAAVGSALGILGFFTGGAAWAAAGAVGATACGVGAAAVAYNSVVDVNSLRQLAQDMKGCSDKLGVIAKELEDRVDTALHLDKEMTAALQNLLAFFISGQRKDDLITQLRKENEEKDTKIAELEEMLRQQGII